MAVPNNKRGFPNHQSGAEEYIEEEKTISMFKVMICNVFVCNVWKAAGLFADINNQVSFLAITSYSHNFSDSFMILYQFLVLCIIPLLIFPDQLWGDLGERQLPPGPL